MRLSPFQITPSQSKMKTSVWEQPTPRKKKHTDERVQQAKNKRAFRDGRGTRWLRCRCCYEQADASRECRAT